MVLILALLPGYSFAQSYSIDDLPIEIRDQIDSLGSMYDFVKDHDEYCNKAGTTDDKRKLKYQYFCNEIPLGGTILGASHERVDYLINLSDVDMGEKVYTIEHKKNYDLEANIHWDEKKESAMLEIANGEKIELTENDRVVIDQWRSNLRK